MSHMQALSPPTYHRVDRMIVIVLLQRLSSKAASLSVCLCLCMSITVSRPNLFVCLSVSFTFTAVIFSRHCMCRQVLTRNEFRLRKQKSQMLLANKNIISIVVGLPRLNRCAAKAAASVSQFNAKAAAAASLFLASSSPFQLRRNSELVSFSILLLSAESKDFQHQLASMVADDSLATKSSHYFWIARP